MASSTLLYIAWPLTLGLSFMAGSMIFSNDSTADKLKISRGNSSQNGSRNKNSATINRRFSNKRSPAYAESHDNKKMPNTSDPLNRMTEFLRMLEQLGPGDFEQALADILKVKSARLLEYDMLVNAWAKKDPKGALNHARKNHDFSEASSAILTAWAEYAPDAAIQWLKLNHKGDNLNSHLVHIIIGISKTNLQRATNMLQEISLDRKNSDKAFYKFASHVSNLGVEKATAWLASIKDEKLRASVTHRLAESLATKDPQGTIDWLQAFPEDTQKTIYGDTIARAWAKLDINKAAEWTISLDPKTRTFTARKIIQQFASSDPNKAAAWLKTMSNDRGYSYLPKSFFHATKRNHPEIALEHHDAVFGRSGGMKYELLRFLAIKDKGAAIKWMQSNSIDTAIQEKILSAAGKGFDRKKDTLPNRDTLQNIRTIIY